LRTAQQYWREEVRCGPDVEWVFATRLGGAEEQILPYGCCQPDETGPDEIILRA
jgi:hypothetical protein